MKNLIVFLFISICFLSCKKDTYQKVSNTIESKLSVSTPLDTISIGTQRQIDSMLQLYSFRTMGPINGGVIKDKGLPAARTVITSGTDYSGQVEVKIWGDYVDGNHNHVEVSVDNDFVMIGGGARISTFTNTNTNVQALLYSSYPKDDGTFSTYVAESKDHIITYSHRLWVYVIGMRILDTLGNPYPSDSLKAFLSINKTTSSSAAHPTTSTSAPTGYSLLSGGAKINWNGVTPGNLLTQSMYPLSYTSWQASGKDHGSSSPATIESYVLSINQTNLSFLTGWTLDIAGTFGTGSAGASSGTKTSTLTATSSYVISGVGGYAAYGGTGRMLYEMYPIDAYSAKVSDKDHSYADNSGYLYSFINFIRKHL